MRYHGTLRLGIAVILAVLIGLASAEAIWAQQPTGQPASPGPSSTPGDASTSLTAMAGVAAVLGNIFYIPFKALAMCPGMALASGASYAVTGGHKDTAEYFLRIGCTGTYVITPAMVRGQDEFQGSGAR